MEQINVHTILNFAVKELKYWIVHLQVGFGLTENKCIYSR
jgi:hypothetical protein